MIPLTKQWFYKGFYKKLKESIPSEKADSIWSEAGKEYHRMLETNPGIRKHKGAECCEYRLRFVPEKE